MISLNSAVVNHMLDTIERGIQETAKLKQQWGEQARSDAVYIQELRRQIAILRLIISEQVE